MSAAGPRRHGQRGQRRSRETPGIAPVGPPSRTEARGPKSVPVVLASRSPRRARILEVLRLSFSVVPPAVEERREPGEAPARYVERMARAKASAVADPRPGALTVAGDTVVALDGAVLEKPDGAKGAAAMLSALSGRAHTVYSGIALARGGLLGSAVAEATVAFGAASQDAIEAYVATGEPLDKAGGYGIQGCGAAFVERVEGDFYGVMGLPVAAFVRLAGALGLEYRPGRLEPQ